MRDSAIPSTPLLMPDARPDAAPGGLTEQLNDPTLVPATRLRDAPLRTPVLGQRSADRSRAKVGADGGEPSPGWVESWIVSVDGAVVAIATSKRQAVAMLDELPHGLFVEISVECLEDDRAVDRASARRTSFVVRRLTPGSAPPKGRSTVPRRTTP
jgi:hypothetical protein